MSQQQTVRITTTETSTSSAWVINTGYLKTPPGLLKIAQFVNIFVYFFFYLFRFRKYKNFLFIFFFTFLMCWSKIDFGMHLRWHYCISFQWSVSIDPIWTFLLFDVRYILAMYHNFIIVVFNFMEHWRHHIQDNLCE